MYNPNRIFRHTDFESGICAWFFEAREGLIGPFDSEAHARAKLDGFVKQKIEANDAGGRGENLKAELTKLPTRSCGVIKLK